MSELSLAAAAAQVVFPLLDLRAGCDPVAAWELAERRARAGFGGFILFGGELEAVRAGAERLAGATAPGPAPLLASDLERGLGQQVRGGSILPPFMAVGAADDPALARRLGEELGREARAAGIDWVFAPVLDLADRRDNPIVGTRALGAEPERVATLGAAFVQGLQAGGALACAKHFPGHGGTRGDSHAELPRVEHSAEQLRARDLLPFRRAFEAGVASVMSAHVAFPTLGGGADPATLSPALIEGLLRRELGFAGLVVSDALIMDGALSAAGSAEAAACRALTAGVDVLLYPEQPEAVAAAVAAWAGQAPERAARLRQAAGRLLALKGGLAARPRPPLPLPTSDLPARLAGAALVRRGPAALALTRGDEVGLLVLDDDAVPGLGHELVATLVEAGVALRLATLTPTSSAAEQAAALARVGAAPRRLVVVGCRVRAWKGRPGLAEPLAAALAGLDGAGLTVVGLCGPYPLAGACPAGASVLVAWGDEPCCQRAAGAAPPGGAAPRRAPPPLEEPR